MSSIWTVLRLVALWTAEELFKYLAGGTGSVSSKVPGSVIR